MTYSILLDAFFTYKSLLG